MSSGAIGILETRGMASLMASTDAMLKAAEVQLCGRHGIGSGWLTAVITGQVADVEAAIRVGEVEANRTGELIGAQVVPRPDARATDAMPPRNRPRCRTSPAAGDWLVGDAGPDAG